MDQDLPDFGIRCIIQLGIPGFILGFDIDTSHFSGKPACQFVSGSSDRNAGNEAPEASVQALFSMGSEEPGPDDDRVCHLSVLYSN
jgi:allantoicase